MSKSIRHNPESQAVIYVRVPGWLKNAISDHCTISNISINRWAATMLKEAYEEGKQIPVAPPAQAPLPTTRSVVRDYLLGETTLEPCGRVVPCERAEAGTFRVAGLEYCTFCRIRVS